MVEDGREPVEVGATVTRTYVLLFETAKVSLDAAGTPGCDPFHHCLQVIVMTAFGLEAYLNHCGARLFKFWPSLRWLRPVEKLTVICTQLRMTPDMGAPPYQAFAQAFAVRDLAAHAETVTRPFERPAGPAGRIPAPMPSTLELECTLAKADRVFNDAMHIVQEIHSKAGEKLAPFAIVGQTTWTRPAR